MGRKCTATNHETETQDVSMVATLRSVACELVDNEADK
jgi:hypothetical protein